MQWALPLHLCGLQLYGGDLDELGGADGSIRDDESNYCNGRDGGDRGNGLLGELATLLSRDDPRDVIIMSDRRAVATTSRKLKRHVEALGDSTRRIDRQETEENERR